MYVWNAFLRADWKSWVANRFSRNHSERSRRNLRRQHADKQARIVEVLEQRTLLAAASGAAETLGSIHTNGDQGNFEYYASGNDDSFSEYGIASFVFEKTDFGLAGNEDIDDITSAKFVLTYNDRSFTDGDDVEIFLTTQVFGGDYSGLTYNSALDNGIDGTQFSTPLVSLGVFPFDPSLPGGSVFEYSLEFEALEADIIDRLNSGGEFSLIIGVTEPTDDITFSGLDNNFDPGDPTLELDVTSVAVADNTPPAIAALSPKDDAVDVSIDSALIATFDELVQVGTGSIEILEVGTNALVESFDVATSAQVSISGADVTVTPSSDLPADADLYVTIANGAIEDIAGNDFGGIAGDAAWNFTTEVADLPPVVINNGPFTVSENASAGTVVGDVESDDDGNGETGLTYTIESISAADSMAVGLNGFQVDPIFTVGQTLTGTTGDLNPTTAGDYTPPGVLDGLGAFELNDSTVRVLANHELLHFRGYDYEVSNGQGGTFTLDGARIS